MYAIRSYYEPGSSEPFTQEEVAQIIKSLPKYKSPGPDGIPADVLLECSEIVAPYYTILMNKILEVGSLPNEMTKSDLIPIFKRGSLSDI